MGERTTTTVAGGFLLPECPRWHDGALWFCDMLRGRVHRLVGDGEPQTVGRFDHPTAVGFRPNGDVLVADADKQLLHTVVENRVAHSVDLSSTARGRLNDMVVDRDGRAYVDDIGPDPFRTGWKPDGRILLVEPDGDVRVVAEGLLSPNGIDISPDGRTLVVGESMGPGGSPAGAQMLAFDVAADGSLSNRRLAGTIARGSGDGLCFDADGGVWIGTAFGHEVQRFVGGEVVERIRVADRKWALACALGGPELRSLFVCTTAAPPAGDPARFTDGWIEVVDVEVPGVARW